MTANGRVNDVSETATAILRRHKQPLYKERDTANMLTPDGRLVLSVPQAVIGDAHTDETTALHQINAQKREIRLAHK